ncbi:MAG TPA: cupin domain-containing protein [Acetobacteraceae bacterium]|nr:cupin domain-containing protein [Acetobacteraceae bacterium]
MTEFTLRREVLLTALASALPIALANTASASPLNPKETIIRLPSELQWVPNRAYPERSVDNCMLVGDLTRPGLYYTLIRWWPGFMSAPHHYATDRWCVVVSGTWWVNSGADFDPARCVPVPAGSFVHRVAGTPHYDGVIRGHHEPVVIAICGMAPVQYQLIDPSLPGVRRV